MTVKPMTDREVLDRNGREMWLSTRSTCPKGPFQESHRGVRSIDGRFNPCIEGNYEVYSLDDVWSLLDESGLIPAPASGQEYHLLFMNALTVGDLPQHPRLTLLGYELAEESCSSSLFERGLWFNELAAIANRAGAHGLLSFEDARLAQPLLTANWPDDTAGIETIWALFDVAPKG